jgi:EmrB/QacA subfamily drug resistance transporter
MRGTTIVQRGTLAVVCAGIGMLMVDIAVVNTALSNIAHDLDAGLGGLQWVVDAYTLTLATIVLTAGALADRVGRRRIFAIGLAIFTTASLMCALAPGIVALDIARAVQGLGGAFMFATALALLATAFPDPRKRGVALGLYGAAIGASFAAGPLVGGALTSSIGWRSVFFVNVPLGIAALAATYAWAPESRDPRPRRTDWAGQATLSVGLFLVVLALLRGSAEGWTAPAILVEAAVGVAALAAFVLVELRSRAPMLPLGLFRRPAFAGAQIAAFAIATSFFAGFVYTTLYLQEVLGLSPIEAGLVYLPGTVLMFVASLATARLARRVAPGALVVAGLVLASVGMALMLLVGTTTSWLVFVPGAALACIGTGLFNPSVSGVLLSSVEPEQAGLASGSGVAFRQAGIAVGVAAFGALIPADAAVGRGDPAAYVAGLHEGLLAGAIVAAIGAFVAARLIGVRRRPAVVTPLRAEPLAEAA